MIHVYSSTGFLGETVTVYDHLNLFLLYLIHVEQIEIDSLSKSSVCLSSFETLKSIIYCPRNVFSYGVVINLLM